VTAAPEDSLDRLTRLARSERLALVRTAQREGIGPEDALECVQEAFCTFLRLEREGEIPGGPDKWLPFLSTVVRNGARNRRRRHHLARPHELLEEPAPGDALPPIDELLLRAEEHVRLRACVEELCEIQRSVVTLRLLEERPGEDVAALLGVSRGYVDVLLHRAKASLRTCLVSSS
jgi:RNA polymerase sigma-70 factor (ECF subfamily)